MSRKASREGIHIEREVADAVAIDEELDSSLVGSHLFPDPVRRRIPAFIYLALAVLVGFLWEPWSAGIPAGLGLWHLTSSWRLRIDERQAMTTAATAVDFPIGHASAAVTFHGLRARPRWSVVLYAASEPPDRRALVIVDAVVGEVVGEAYVEQIPAPG